MSTLLAWQQALSDMITDPLDLLSTLDLSPADLPTEIITDSHFPLRVPKPFVARMQKGNPLDPLLLQVLPRAAEVIAKIGYTKDPLQELAANPIPGLLHKFHGRVLVTAAGSCAINCRYCFRQYFPYEENSISKERFQQIYSYIHNDESISEVILSGGEPLIVKDHKLAQWVHSLESIPHLQRLRIHTRLPIVIPDRINEELLQWIEQSRFQMILVIHCNHANEIDDAVIAKLQALKKIGVTLLNQSVLLKGINDHADTLIALSERLFAAGVLPYYLNLLDRVLGSSHFEVPETMAISLRNDMLQKLPGYLVPKFVRELAGAPNKMTI